MGQKPKEENVTQKQITQDFELREHDEPAWLDWRSLARSAGGLAASGVAVTIGGVVGLTSCRCGQDDRFNYDAWAETDGAAGRINMGAVRQAFEEANDPTDFERRVNEIYEGHHPILVRVYSENGTQKVEGWEDLNDNASLDMSSDDKLFTLTRGQERMRLEGHGANSYYHHQFPVGHAMGGFLTGYVIGSMLSGPYVTPPSRVRSIRRHVRSYRSSPAYRRQQARNTGFFSRQRASNPRFRAASKNLSSARQSFRSQVRSSGGRFRSSFSPSGRFRGGGR